MALIANICIHQCDCCSTLIVCQDEASHIRFETEWHETILHDFCPDCRNKPAVRKTIVRDRLVLKQSLTKTPSEVEGTYAN